MSILRSEVSYPYYPGKYGIAPEYTNVTSSTELKQVLHDGKVIECIQSLLGELLGGELVNTETKAGKKQVDTVMDTLESLDLSHLAASLSSTMILGRSVHEVVWETKPNGLVLPSRLVYRDIDILRYYFENPRKGMTPWLWVRGKEMPVAPRKYIIARYWAIPNDDPYGNGLGEALYPLVVSRNQAIVDWGKFSSTYAEPVRIGTYPVDASDEEISAFNGFIQALGVARAVTLPDGFEVNYVDPPTAQSGLQKDLYDTINQDISLLILGETTAGKADPGNRAKDEISDKLRVTKAQQLGSLITQTLNNTLAVWIQQLNFPTKPPVKLQFKPKDVEPQTRQVPESNQPTSRQTRNRGKAKSDNVNQLGRQPNDNSQEDRQATD